VLLICHTAIVKDVVAVGIAIQPLGSVDELEYDLFETRDITTGQTKVELTPDATVIFGGILYGRDLRLLVLLDLLFRTAAGAGVISHWLTERLKGERILQILIDGRQFWAEKDAGTGAIKFVEGPIPLGVLDEEKIEEKIKEILAEKLRVARVQ